MYTTIIFCSYLSNHLEFQREILHVHLVILYTHDSLQCFKDLKPRVVPGICSIYRDHLVFD